MLEKCLEAGLPVDHLDEDILGSVAQVKGETGPSAWKLGRVSSGETDMRPWESPTRRRDHVQAAPGSIFLRQQAKSKGAWEEKPDATIESS